MTGEKEERGRKSQDKRGSSVVGSGSSQTCEKMSVGGCACPGKYRHSRGGCCSAAALVVSCWLFHLADGACCVVVKF